MASSLCTFKYFCSIIIVLYFCSIIIAIKGYLSSDILYFCNQHNIKCSGYDWKIQPFITNKMNQSTLIKIFLCLYFILIKVIYIQVLFSVVLPGLKNLHGLHQVCTGMPPDGFNTYNIIPYA